MNNSLYNTIREIQNNLEPGQNQLLTPSQDHPFTVIIRKGTAIIPHQSLGVEGKTCSYACRIFETATPRSKGTLARLEVRDTPFTDDRKAIWDIFKGAKIRRAHAPLDNFTCENFHMAIYEHSSVCLTQVTIHKGLKPAVKNLFRGVEALNIIHRAGKLHRHISDSSFHHLAHRDTLSRWDGLTQTTPQPIEYSHLHDPRTVKDSIPAIGIIPETFSADDDLFALGRTIEMAIVWASVEHHGGDVSGLGAKFYDDSPERATKLYPGRVFRNAANIIRVMPSDTARTRLLVREIHKLDTPERGTLIRLLDLSMELQGEPKTRPSANTVLERLSSIFKNPQKELNTHQKAAVDLLCNWFPNAPRSRFETLLLTQYDVHHQLRVMAKADQDCPHNIIVGPDSLLVIGPVIGSGGSGIVHEVKQIKTNTDNPGFTSKAVKLSLQSGSPAKRVLQQHVTRVTHLNTIEETFAIENTFYSLHPLCAGTLAQVDYTSISNATQTALIFAQGVAYGLKALHIKGLVHQDVKGPNILIERGVVQLADWESLSTTSEGEENVIWTKQYIDPDKVLTKKIRPEHDLYAFGRVVEMDILGRLLPKFKEPEHRSAVMNGMIQYQPSDERLKQLLGAIEAFAANDQDTFRLKGLAKLAIDLQNPNLDRRPTADQAAEILRSLIKSHRRPRPEEALPRRKRRLSYDQPIDA